MPRRGYSTTVGKFAKFYQNRRASEIRVLGELLRSEQRAAPSMASTQPHDMGERPTVR